MYKKGVIGSVEDGRMQTMLSVAFGAVRASAWLHVTQPLVCSVSDPSVIRSGQPDVYWGHKRRRVRLERALPGAGGGEGPQWTGLQHVHHPEGRPHRYRGEGATVSSCSTVEWRC